MVVESNPRVTTNFYEKYVPITYTLNKKFLPVATFEDL